MRLIALALCVALPQEKQDPPPPAASTGPSLRSVMECRPHRIQDEYDDLGKRDDGGTVTGDACTFEDAMKRVRAWLEANVRPEAMAALKADPAAKKARGLIALAGAAAAKRHMSAVVAALMEALAIEPGNATALANLAAALPTVGLCAEAIAVADKALAGAGDKKGAMGIPLAAVAHNARGYALLRQGNAVEAAKSLRSAVSLGGELASEAAANLACALKKAGEEEEAKKFFLASCWRHGVEKPFCSGGRTPKPGEPAKTPWDRGVKTLLPTARAFDLSFGKPGKFPTFRHPQNVKQFKVFDEFYEREMKAGLEHQRKFEAFVKANGAIVPGNTPADKRAHMVVQYVTLMDDDPDIAPLFTAMNKGSQDLFEKYQRVYKAAREKSEEIRKNVKDDRRRNALLLEHANALINEMNGPCNAFDDLMRKYWEKSYQYMSGAASNIKSKFWHERAMWRIRVMMWTMWVRLVKQTRDTYEGVYQAAGKPDETAGELEVPGKTGPDEEDVPN